MSQPSKLNTNPQNPQQTQVENPVSQDTTQPQPSSDISNPPSSLANKKMKILFLVFLMIAVIFLIAYLYFQNRSSSISDISTAPSAESFEQDTKSPVDGSDLVADSIVLDRSQLSKVDQRAITALETNDTEALYKELSPSQQQLFSREAFMQAEQKTAEDYGRVIRVEILESASILTESDWDGMWAQSHLRLIREKITQEYLVRYYLDGDQWYLFATIDVTP